MAVANSLYIWRRSPKTIDQVEQAAATKKILYSRRGISLDVFNPGQGWITFLHYNSKTYYRRMPEPSVRATRPVGLPSPSFLCESCRHVLPVNEMVIIETEQMPYATCRDCCDPFSEALKELGYTVYLL